jgi:pimeloyl-ACP methyl ester carboxylesterase
MTKFLPASPLKHLRPSDLRGIARLAAQGTSGVTHIVEGVHRSVLATVGVAGRPPHGRTQGITGLVYRSIHGVTQLVGKGVDLALTGLQPVFDKIEQDTPGSPQREAVLAALNGVMGDRLAEDGNPLATQMTLRFQGQALEWNTPPAPVSSKVLLLIHGLCMNDLQWTTMHDGQLHDHGAALAGELGYTPIYLRYNSGLHISQNGRQLAALLEDLLARWPVPITELNVVGHSMGGLVIRSAIDHAAHNGYAWPAQLKNIVFLGAPHHGAPLERAGNKVDLLLGATPWSAPLAKLGQLRSAGITDLRHGFVTDRDWLGQDRFELAPRRHTVLPLPTGVACYAVAATLAPKRGLLAERLTGDGLVPLRSALGQHNDPARCLGFAHDAQFIAYRTGHLALLSNPDVMARMLHWLRQS